MSLSRLDVFQKPQCLISSKQSGFLVVHRTVLSEIAAIETPIVVIAIVGPYRTGKSYLMNRLAQAKTGFTLGNTTQATTKGIWVWCKKHPTQSNTTLLLMDTEGLGDVKKGDADNDNKIFTLAVLLCRGLCYNNIGVLDEGFLEKLALSSKLARMIYANTNQEYSLNSPELIVCLRDFLLDLEQDGKTLSENEYLESGLQPLPAKNKQHSREEIKQLFVHRKCFTFEPPGNRRVLRNIEIAREEDLSAGFLKDTKKFTTYIYTIQPGIMPDKTKINGPVFAALLTSFVEDFKKGFLPDIPSSLQRWRDQEVRDIVDAISMIHSEQLATIKLPILNTVKFNSVCEERIYNCLREVRKNVPEDRRRVSESQARTQIEMKVDNMRKNNEKMCYMHWHHEITELYKKEVGLKTGYFYNGGYQQYMNKLRTLQTTWKKQFPPEKQRERAYNEFMETKATDKEDILKEDNKIREQEEKDRKRILAEKQKKEEEERMRENQRRWVEFQAEEERKRKQLQIQERDRREHRRRELQRLEYEQNAYMREQERRMQQLEIERKQLERAGREQQERARREQQERLAEEMLRQVLVAFIILLKN